MVKPKTKQAFPDVHAMIDLKMEYILKKAKKKAKLAVVSIITKDPGILDDDEHKWLDLIAKTCSMDKFEKLKSDLDAKKT